MLCHLHPVFGLPFQGTAPQKGPHLFPSVYMILISSIHLQLLAPKKTKGNSCIIPGSAFSSASVPFLQ